MKKLNICLFLFGIATIALSLMAIKQIAKAQEKVTLKLLGTVELGRSFSGLIASEDLNEIEKAVAKTFVKAYPGGDKREAYSTNGEYKILKSPHPKYIGNEKAEMAPIISTLVDKSGKVIWKGETDEDVFISNNGRNFVSGNLTYGVGIKFYDISSPEPIKTYDIGFDGGAFSDDGRYFIAWAKDLYFFEADGALLWKKEFTFHGTKKAIISSQGSFIMINDKPAEQPEQQKQSKQTVKDEKPAFPIPIERMNEMMRIKILREQGRFAEADSLEKELSKSPPMEKIEPNNIKKGTPIKLTPGKSSSTITFLRQNGTFRQYTTEPMWNPIIFHMAFSPDDGRYAVASTNNRLLFFDTETSTLLWEYKLDGSYSWITSIDISQNGEYVVVMASVRPEKEGIVQPKILRCYLINRNGERILEMDVDALGEIAFSENGEYLLSRTRIGRIYLHQMESTQ